MNQSPQSRRSLTLATCLLAGHLHAAETVRITRFEPGPTRRLEWQGPPGWYIVQATPDLGFGVWGTLAMIPGTDTEVPVRDRQQFLRVEHVAPGRVTVFDGGTLAELRAIRPSLQFDCLVISGPLQLPLWGTVTLMATDVVVLPSGSIRVTRTPCQHGDAPGLSIRASDSVAVLGEVLLIGESGTRALPSASCETSSGYPGGDLSIVAKRIQLGARIDVSGGAGGTIVNGVVGSQGQQGAAGGEIRLQAEAIWLDGAQVRTRGGAGGYGGDGGTAARGAPGAIALQAMDLVVRRSQVETDGLLDVAAARPRIHSPLLSGRQEWNWNGVSDDGEPPVILVRSPATGSRVDLGRPLRVEIEVADRLSGVRELEVRGLGVDGVFPAEGPVWVREVALPGPPQRLTVVARDNDGNEAMVTVDPVHLAGDLVVPAGVVYRIPEDLDLGPQARIDIAGEVVLPRGRRVRVAAGTLHLAESGRVSLEEVVPANPATPAEWVLDLAGPAVLSGTIDFTGHEGLNQRGSSRPAEKGGGLTLDATDITLRGRILLRGGRAGGSYQVWESSLGGLVNVGQNGADGGALRLAATGGITFVDGGLIALDGGRESPGVNSPKRGGGGVFWGASPKQTYADAFDIDAPAAAFFVLLGAENVHRMVEAEGTQAGKNNAMASAEPLPLFAEVQRGVWAGLPIEVSGTITAEDQGSLVVTFDKGVKTDVEDLYRLTIPEGVPADLTLEMALTSVPAAGVDLDLLVFEADTLQIMGSGEGPGSRETVSGLVLAPGSYGIGVVHSGPDLVRPPSFDYTLTVSCAR